MIAASQNREGIAARFQFGLSGEGNKQFSLDLNFQIPGKGITAIFGKSGSGKTTLLRCLAGLQGQEKGEVRVNGEVWLDASRNLPTHQRPLGYVFQESSLLPHLSAGGNLAYAMKRTGSDDSEEMYKRVLALMGIESILDRNPSQLSGGERQRVAIARALLIKPRLLLMDEPLASLDLARKQEILPYLKRLPEEFDLPILYVTHSLDEVAALADRLLVLDEGRVVANGSLGEVLSRVDLPVQLGEETGSVLDVKVAELDEQWSLARVEFAGGELWIKDRGDAIGSKLRIRVLARDVSIALAAHDDSSILNRLAVEVMEIADDTDGAMALVKLAVGNEALVARISRKSLDHLQIAVGKKVWAQIKSVAILQ